MEFLIGRSLANNVTNLLLGPGHERSRQAKGPRLVRVLEQEPDAGLGNGGLGRLAACFLDSLATMQIPAMGSASATNTASSSRRFRMGGNMRGPDNWLRRPDPWEVVRPHETVEVKLNCSFEMRGGSCERYLASRLV